MSVLPWSVRASATGIGMSVAGEFEMLEIDAAPFRGAKSAAVFMMGCDPF
jgi:hypothetical protein